MKKRLIIIILVTAAVFSAAAVFALAKPDLLYPVWDRVRSLWESAELEEITDGEFILWNVNDPVPEALGDAEVVFDESLLLVNSRYPLSEDYSPDVGEYGDSGVIMNRCVFDSYAALSRAVSEETGEKLYIMSAYRSAEEQAAAIAEEGENAAGVGESEHMAGLALDVYVKYYAGAGFLKSESGRFVNSNCGDYGFIIRYPYYGEDQTGMGYEPWHIRYVGLPHSQIISKERLTLEGYMELLVPGRVYGYGGYVISRSEGDEVCIPEGYRRYVVSPDNSGGYVVTGAR